MNPETIDSALSSRPFITRRTREMAASLQLPPIKLHIFASADPEALTDSWATPPSISLSTELLAMLTDREVVGVIAHELGHISMKSQERFLMAAPTAAGAAIGLAASSAFAPPADPTTGKRPGGITRRIMFFGGGSTLGKLIGYNSMQRQTEYVADINGAIICQDPQAVISALERIQRWEEANGITNASSHPDTKDRIETLKRYDFSEALKPNATSR